MTHYPFNRTTYDNTVPPGLIEMDKIVQARMKLGDTEKEAYKYYFDSINPKL